MGLGLERSRSVVSVRLLEEELDLLPPDKAFWLFSKFLF